MYVVIKKIWQMVDTNPRFIVNNHQLCLDSTACGLVTCAAGLVLAKMYPSGANQ
jgi:hypothetical protein